MLNEFVGDLNYTSTGESSYCTSEIYKSPRQQMVEYNIILVADLKVHSTIF